MTALPYLFARLSANPVRSDNGVALPSVCLDNLAYLRQRYSQFFALEEGLGEIMLVRLAVADAPGYASRRRHLDEVWLTTYRG